MIWYPGISGWEKSWYMLCFVIFKAVLPSPSSAALNNIKRRYSVCVTLRVLTPGPGVRPATRTDPCLWPWARPATAAGSRGAGVGSLTGGVHRSQLSKPRTSDAVTAPESLILATLSHATSTQSSLNLNFLSFSQPNTHLFNSLVLFSRNIERKKINNSTRTWCCVCGWA